MSDYKEFQFGWLIFGIIIPVQILTTCLYLNNMGDKPIQATELRSSTQTVLLVCLLFYGLTTKITVERIKTVESVKNPWYYGWGIRFIPNGMLYNIGGSDAVGLRFNDMLVAIGK